MPNTILLKRSNSLAQPPALLDGEIAWSNVSDILFIGKGNTVLEIGGPGAFAKLNSPTFIGTPQAPTPPLADDSTRLATTAFVKGQNYLTGNQTITLSGDASGSGTTSISLTLNDSGVTPGTYTKLGVNSKGLITSGELLTEDDIPLLHSTKIVDFLATVRTVRINELDGPNDSLNMNEERIVDLANPQGPYDAANKRYVDSVAQGLKIKGAVRVATTENIALFGEIVVDGISLLSMDRVLVKNQDNPSENGVYNVMGSNWARSVDFDSEEEVLSSSFFFVQEGSANADTAWVMTSDGPITLDTTPIVFTQFSSATAMTAQLPLEVIGREVRLRHNTDILDINEGLFLTVTGVNDGRVLMAAGPGLDARWSRVDLENIDTIEGTLQPDYGGTGATNLTGILMGNGSNPFTTATPHVDYLTPESVIDGGTY